MKKIIISLAIVAAVAAVVVVGTTAFFSDEEKSTGNTFTAGTIDIALGQGQLPVTLKDMKPSQVAYSNFTVLNTGTNPVNVTKTIKTVTTDENGVNEPECLAYGGTWTPNDDQANHCAGGTPVNIINSVIQYDLSVKLYKDSVLVWNQTLNDMNQTVAQRNGQPSFLGMLPAGLGWRMDVVESYHMNSDAGNAYQSDKMTFDIVVTGEQLKGVAVLSNKDPDRPVKDGWFVLGEKIATLTYGVKDSQFKFSLNWSSASPEC